MINDVIMKLPMRVRMMMGPAGVGAGGGGSVTAGVARGPSQNLGKMGSSLAMLAGASQVRADGALCCHGSVMNLH